MGLDPKVADIRLVRRDVATGRRPHNYRPATYVISIKPFGWSIIRRRPLATPFNTCHMAYYDCIVELVERKIRDLTELR